MKKRGFTLIELLAVIVVLAIIALIAVPIVLGVIDKAKRGAFEDSVKVSSRQVELYLFKNNLSKIPENGISVNDLDIKSDFTDGKFKEENGVVIAYFIKNKDYCAYGPIDNLIIRKDCNDLDISYPTIDDSKLATTRTSNSITVILSEGFAIDEESGIVKYEINIYDGSTKLDSETLSDIGNVTFEKLTNGKEYKIEVIVTNGNDMTSSATRNVTTVAVDTPTYSVSPSSDEKEWAPSRTVTIAYPEGYTNEYSIDSGETWNPYTEPIVFLQPGTVIARVFDGTNYITGNSQTIGSIDSDKPTSSDFSYTRTSKSITAIATGTDATTEIVGYAFSNDGGNTWTDEQSGKSYTFEELETGSYNIKVRVFDKAGNYLDSEVQNVATVTIDKPTYSVSPESGWATSKTVTIAYPEGYTNEYSLDSGSTWHPYTTPIVLTDIGATEATVVARVTDGKNVVEGNTYKVREIYLTTAQNVSFTPDDSNWNVDNVYDALEDLRNN